MLSRASSKSWLLTEISISRTLSCIFGTGVAAFAELIGFIVKGSPYDIYLFFSANEESKSSKCFM
jgi:hypothetical protein